ncbi:LOW QUALITY PROTEIN: hypothetical protein RJ640_017422 [Escallonia rubra]|uniref:Uncharacterized protein n=1 Tax=Escallonia rubra TaxID=112253 RepID=A0AA88U6Z9_9ASTE|nr:LOW QUALITY PROTEIN: hypothetical protein RJ640_017422 [Escallonia rubra]
MSAVLGMLQGHISVQEANIDPSIYGDDLMLQSLRDKCNEMRSENSTEAETLLQSSDAAPNDSSSTSAHHSWRQIGPPEGGGAMVRRAALTGGDTEAWKSKRDFRGTGGEAASSPSDCGGWRDVDGGKRRRSGRRGGAAHGPRRWCSDISASRLPVAMTASFV